MKRDGEHEVDGVDDGDDDRLTDELISQSVISIKRFVGQTQAFVKQDLCYFS